MHHIAQLVARHIPIGAEDRAGGADRGVGLQIDYGHALGAEVLVASTPHNLHGPLLRAQLVDSCVKHLHAYIKYVM